MYIRSCPYGTACTHCTHPGLQRRIRLPGHCSKFRGCKWALHPSYFRFRKSAWILYLRYFPRLLFPSVSARFQAPGSGVLTFWKFFFWFCALLNLFSGILPLTPLVACFAKRKACYCEAAKSSAQQRTNRCSSGVSQMREFRSRHWWCLLMFRCYTPVLLASNFLSFLWMVTISEKPHCLLIYLSFQLSLLLLL